MTLGDALGVTGAEVVALVGGGGKSTAMFRLAREMVDKGGQVITTTTTKIFGAQIALSPAHVFAEDVTRERVAAALHLDRADRAPVSAWGHSFEREWSVDELATTTVGIARRCQLDFVKLQVRASCFAETFRAAWRYSGSPSLPPVMEQPGGRDAKAWQRIAATEPDRRRSRERQR